MSSVTDGGSHWNRGAGLVEARPFGVVTNGAGVVGDAVPLCTTIGGFGLRGGLAGE